MTGRPLLDTVPSVRDLLARASWDDLHRLAARHGVQLGGRRRDLAVERLATALERPQQLRAAYHTLTPTAQAVLTLLMLLGTADDEQALHTARDQVLALRPELHSQLVRVQIGYEIPTLLSLGLCFRDRRRLVVPAEVLGAVPLAFAPATPIDPLTTPAIPYALLRYQIEQLVAAIERDAPAAVQPHLIDDARAGAYQPLLLPTTVTQSLADELAIAPSTVVLLCSLLHEQGVIADVRGRWQVQVTWHALRDQAPQVFMKTLLGAWLRPRVFSDLARTHGWAWMHAPDADVVATVGQHDARLRTIVWHWLQSSGGTALDLANFAAMLRALHAPLLHGPDTRSIWRQATAGSRASQDPDAEIDHLARRWLRELIQQLHALGFVIADDTACAASALAVLLRDGTLHPDATAPITSANATTLHVQPFAVAPDVLRQIALAGHMIAPVSELARFQLTAAGMAQLRATGVSITQFEQTLLGAGAQLAASFRDRLATWAAKAGRVRLHRPLAIMLTAEGTPLAQVLAVAGLADAAEELGSGCAAIEPERADAALAALRSRGFWPQEIKADQGT